MIYLWWLLLALIDYAMLLPPVAYLYWFIGFEWWMVIPPYHVIALGLSLLTANGWPRWGGWFWTYDNPPQGDEGYQKKRAVFLNPQTPFHLYVNRVWWLWRNPLYGYQKGVGLGWGDGLEVRVLREWGGGVHASDKYRIPGGYYAECRNDFHDILGFELYIVVPYTSTRCVRLRLGWKMVTDKFQSKGFAPFVDTLNPFDGYGDD